MQIYIETLLRTLNRLLCPVGASQQHILLRESVLAGENGELGGSRESEPERGIDRNIVLGELGQGHLHV